MRLRIRRRRSLSLLTGSARIVLRTFPAQDLGIARSAGSCFHTSSRASSAENQGVLRASILAETIPHIVPSALCFAPSLHANNSITPPRFTHPDPFLIPKPLRSTGQRGTISLRIFAAPGRPGLVGHNKGSRRAPS